MNIGETVRVFRAEPVLSPPLGAVEPASGTAAGEVRAGPGPEQVDLESSSSVPVRLGG